MHAQARDRLAGFGDIAQGSQRLKFGGALLADGVNAGIAVQLLV
jgi:hypothetical protein